VVIVDAADWRTKAAKLARIDAYELGKTPMLQRDYDKTVVMADIAKAYLARTELADLLENGLPEQTMIAQWNGTWLRGRVDWLSTDRKVIMDYKTVGQSANPAEFARGPMFKLGHDIQAATYQMLNGLTGGPKDAAFVWLVQETTAPFACSLIGASPAVLDIGEAKLMTCIGEWEKGLKTGIWEGYGTKTAYPDVPPWEIAKAEEAMSS